MRFRNYCLLVLGETKGVLPEIEKVSETKINQLNANGVLIATFSSVVEPREMDDWFKLNNRSFFIFELDPETSAFHITKKEINEGLFGFLALLKPTELEKKQLELMGVISKEEKIIDECQPIEKELTEADIEKMSQKEKDELFDNLFSNGFENLTENGKKILPLLVK